jgi:hypothetical protein
VELSSWTVQILNTHTHTHTHKHTRRNKADDFIKAIPNLVTESEKVLLANKLTKKKKSGVSVCGGDFWRTELSFLALPLSRLLTVSVQILSFLILIIPIVDSEREKVYLSTGEQALYGTLWCLAPHSSHFLP